MTWITYGSMCCFTVLYTYFAQEIGHGDFMSRNNCNLSTFLSVIGFQITCCKHIHIAMIEPEVFGTEPEFQVQSTI